MSSHSLSRGITGREGQEDGPGSKPRAPVGGMFPQGQVPHRPWHERPRRPTVAPAPARSLGNSTGIKAGAQCVLESPYGSHLKRSGVSLAHPKRPCLNRNFPLKTTEQGVVSKVWPHINAVKNKQTLRVRVANSVWALNCTGKCDI